MWWTDRQTDAGQKINLSLSAYDATQGDTKIDDQQMFDSAADLLYVGIGKAVLFYRLDLTLNWLPFLKLKIKKNKIYIGYTKLNMSTSGNPGS